MAAYSNFPRNPYGFLGSRPANNPATMSDVRKGPVSSFTDGNGESYLMTVETTVQRVPPSAMPAGHYEVASDRPQIVDEFLKKIQTEVSQPARPPAMHQYPYGSPLAAPAVQYGQTTRVDFGDFTNGMPGSVSAIRTTPAPPRPCDTGPSPSVPPSAMPVGHYEVASDRPEIVDEFLKTIQTEVSQPARPPAMYQYPYGSPLAAPAVQFGPTARVNFSDFTNGMPGSVPAIRTTPVPPRPNAKISQAMNDIAMATEYLKELTRPSIPEKDSITVPQNMVPSRRAAVNNASAPVTIDSREAARRYKNIIVSTEPYNKQSSTTPTMDSKTAKDKYKGAFV